MINAERLIETLQDSGFGLITGVPCSYMTQLINTAIASDRMRYIGAANEGEAVSIAAGAELAGVPAVTIFQNSGLGNTVNPITSLTASFKLPVLLITSWRGEPGAAADEPQHDMMGEITPGLFELMGIAWERFPSEEAELPAVIERAAVHMRVHRSPYALIVSKGAIGGDTPAPPRPSPKPSSQFDTPIAGTDASVPLAADDALRTIQAAAGHRTVLLATTGFTGRALYAIGDLDNQLYMVGSMGCASSMALGLAVARPDRRVVVIDGDGALLMRMGALAVIGHEAPRNLVHVVLDNGVHDSTGSQGTVSPFVDLPAVARACGYAHVSRVSDTDALGESITQELAGPAFVHVRTQPRADHKLPRPEIKPYEVADRLRAFLQS